MVGRERLQGSDFRVVWLPSNTLIQVVGNSRFQLCFLSTGLASKLCEKTGTPGLLAELAYAYALFDLVSYTTQQEVGRDESRIE